jgi:hypothetical protein
MEQLRIEVIDRAYAAILAAKTPAERVAMADSAHRAARIGKVDAPDSPRGPGNP